MRIIGAIFRGLIIAAIFGALGFMIYTSTTHDGHPITVRGVVSSTVYTPATSRDNEKFSVVLTLPQMGTVAHNSASLFGRVKAGDSVRADLVPQLTPDGTFVNYELRNVRPL